MIPNLQLLSDDDLDGLESWAEPLTRMSQPRVRRWAACVAVAVADEQRRRDHDDGIPCVPWPGFTDLPTEALVLVGQLLASLHDAGSAYLTAWIEEVSDVAVAELTRRMEDCT